MTKSNLGPQGLWTGAPCLTWRLWTCLSLPEPALERDRGTDPLADPVAVRAAILDVLDGLAAEGLDDIAAEQVEAWARDLHDSVAGYGPLQRLFDDPDVEELWVKCR